MRVVAIVLLLSASAAAEWNVAAYLGGAKTQNSDFRLQLPGRDADLTFRGVPWQGRSFEGPLYYGFRFGSFPGRRFGWQTEFIHMKVYAETERVLPVSGTLDGATLQGTRRMSDLVQRFSISHGANLLLGSFVFRQPLWSSDENQLGRVLLTARAGLGGMIAHAESEVQGRTLERLAGGGFAWQLASGGEVQLWRGVYALAEYKYTSARPQVVVFNGLAESRLNSHHSVTGLSFHF